MSGSQDGCVRQDEGARAQRTRRGDGIGLLGALSSEALRLRRSPLLAAHAVYGLATGLACGAYFATTPWSPGLGADAFVQLLGALAPLAAGIACGLSLDAEREAGGMSMLLELPSRRLAICAKLSTLAALGAGACALALASFFLIMLAAGREALGGCAYVMAGTGLACGSLASYLIALAAALRFGRNAAIGLGAAGSMLAFFSVGGLAHGLMTGELTGAGASGFFGLEPFSWPARLGSLGIESAIARASEDAAAFSQVAGSAGLLLPLCLAASAAGVLALVLAFEKFEDDPRNR